MKLFKKFSLALIGLMITAMLLVACGDSPTPVPAATTAAATATTAPKPTTAAPTTAAPTATTAPTVAPTTAAPTTAAPTATTAPKPTTAAPTTAAVGSTGTFPVPTGAKALNLTPTLTKGLIGLFAKGSGTTDVVFEAYATTQAPEDLSSFYDEQLVAIGYEAHPETQAGQTQGNTSFLSASFTKDDEVLAVALVGPLDQAILTEITGLETASNVSPAQDLTKQLKVGDTLIMAFTLKGASIPTATATTPIATTPATTKPATTTAAATTAASTGPAIKVPATATELNLSPSLAKAIETEFGSGAKNGSIKTYTTQDDIDTLASFFEGSLPTQGYSLIPDSQQKDNQNGVDIVSAGFTNGKDVVVVVMFGPMDESTIALLSGLDPEPVVLATSLISQVKVGDTVIFVVKGTK